MKTSKWTAEMVKLCNYYDSILGYYKTDVIIVINIIKHRRALLLCRLAVPCVSLQWKALFFPELSLAGCVPSSTNSTKQVYLVNDGWFEGLNIMFEVCRTWAQSLQVRLNLGSSPLRTSLTCNHSWIIYQIYQPLKQLIFSAEQFD